MLREKLKKYFVVLGLCGLVIAAGVIALNKSGILVRQFRELIAHRLSQALGREVSVSGLEGGLAFVSLTDVRVAESGKVSAGVLFSCDRIIIDYSFRDIIFGRKDIQDSIESAKIINPVINLRRSSAGGWNFQPLADYLSNKPGDEKQSFAGFGYAVVSMGRINFSDESRSFKTSIERINGRMNFTPSFKSASLRLKARSFNAASDNLSVMGNVGLREGGTDLDLKIANLDLAHYAGYFVSGDGFAVTAGNFSAELNWKNNGIPQGRFYVENAGLKVKNVEFGKIELAGRINEDRVDIDRLTAVAGNAACTVTGRIIVRDDPVLDLRLSAPQVQISELRKYFGGHMELGGQSDISVTVKGTFQKPEISGFAHIRQAKVGPVRVPWAKIFAKYEDKSVKTVSIKARVWNGLLTAEGNAFFRTRALELNGEIAGVNLSSMCADLGNPGFCYGFAGLKFRVTGTIEKPVVKSDLTCTGLGRNQEKLGNLSGQVSCSEKKAELSVQTVDGSIRLGLKMSREKEQPLARLAVEGNLKIVKMDAGKLAGLLPVEVPVKKVAGIVSGSAVLSGTLESPRINGKVSVVNPAWEKIYGRLAETNFEITTEFLSLSSLRISQQGTGSITGSLKIPFSSEGKYSGELKGQKFEVGRMLSHLTGSDVSGRMDFNSVIEGTGHPRARVDASAKLKINQIPADFSSQFTISESKLELGSMSLDNQYYLSGSVGFSPLSFDLKAKAEKGKLVTLMGLAGAKTESTDRGEITGQLSFSGTGVGPVISGDLYVQKPVISGFRQDKLAVNLRTDAGYLRVLFSTEEKSTGCSFSGEAKIGLRMPHIIVLKSDFAETVGQRHLKMALGFSGELAGKELRGELSAENITLDSEWIDPARVSVIFDKRILRVFASGLKNSAGIDGWIDFNTKEVEMTLKLKNVDLPVLAGIFAPQEKISGLINGGIKVTGTLPKWHTEGSLRLGRGTWRDFPFQSGQILFSSENTSLITFDHCRIQQEKGHVNWKGTVVFPDGRISASTAQVDLELGVVNGSLSELSSLIPRKNRPANLSGRLASNLKMQGSLSEPVISGDVTIFSGRYGSFTADSLSTVFSLRNGQFLVTHLKWCQADSIVSVNNGTVKIIDGQVVLNLPVSLEKYILANAPVRGELNCRLTVVPKENVVMYGTISSPELMIGDFRLNKVSTGFEYSKNQVRFTPVPDEATTLSGTVAMGDEETDFQKVSLGIAGSGTVAVNGKWRNRGRSDVSVDADKIPAALLGQLLAMTPFEGQMTFHVKAGGNRQFPKFKGQFHIENGNLWNIRFDLARGYFNAEPNTFHLEECSLMLTDKYNILFDGNIPMALSPGSSREISGKEMKINVKSTGADAELTMLTGWFGAAKGKMDFNLKIGGTTSDPEINGELVIAGAELMPLALVRSFKNCRIKLKAARNNVKIIYASADAGGAVDVSGTFTMKNLLTDMLDLSAGTSDRGIEFFIDSLMKQPGRAKIAGRDGDRFRILGPSSNPKLSGKVFLSNADITYPPASEAEEDSVLSRIFWDVEVVAETKVRYFHDGLGCRINIRKGGHLYFYDLGNRLKVTGELEFEGGADNYFTFLQNKFDVVSANAKFIEVSGQTRMILSAKGQTKLKDVTIFAAISSMEEETGKVEYIDVAHLRPVLSSQPEYSQQQILSYLMVGEDYTTWSNDRVSQKLQQEMTTILAKAGMSYVLKKTRIFSEIKQQTGVDVSVMPTTKSNINRKEEESLPGSRSAILNSADLFRDWEIGLRYPVSDRLSLGVDFIYGGLDELQSGYKWNEKMIMEYHFKEEHMLKIKVDKDEIYGGWESKWSINLF